MITHLSRLLWGRAAQICDDLLLGVLVVAMCYVIVSFTSLSERRAREPSELEKSETPEMLSSELAVQPEIREEPRPQPAQLSSEEPFRLHRNPAPPEILEMPPPEPVRSEARDAPPSQPVQSRTEKTLRLGPARSETAEIPLLNPTELRTHGTVAVIRTSSVKPSSTIARSKNGNKTKDVAPAKPGPNPRAVASGTRETPKDTTSTGTPSTTVTSSQQSSSSTSSRSSGQYWNGTVGISDDESPYRNDQRQLGFNMQWFCVSFDLHFRPRTKYLKCGL